MLDEKTWIVMQVLSDIEKHEGDRSLVAYIIKKFREGENDVSIIMKVPMSRGKYYAVKAELVNTIYEGCISKGIVDYEDIISQRID